jgi:hypothetical protein
MIMASPTWLAYMFAALTAVVAVYCVTRLIVARPRGSVIEYDVDVCHALMAVAMIGMLVPRWNEVSPTVWEVVFLIFLVWFIAKAAMDYRARHGIPGPVVTDHVRHHLFHGLMAFAMLDMYWIGMPLSSAHSGSGMAMSGAHTNPLVTLLAVVALLGFTLWEVDATFVRGSAAVMVADAGGHGWLLVRSDVSPAGTHPLLTPRLEAASFTIMCITMAFSLVLTL